MPQYFPFHSKSMLRGCSMLLDAFTAQETLWSFWQAVSAAFLVHEGAEHLLLLMASRGTSRLPNLEIGQIKLGGGWITLKPPPSKINTLINYIDIQLKRGLMVWDQAYKVLHFTGEYLFVSLIWFGTVPFLSLSNKPINARLTWSVIPLNGKVVFHVLP